MRSTEHPEIGRDPLDAAAPTPLWTQLFPERRAALGLRPSAAPGLTFILFGVALGPQGIGVLSPIALSRLDPIVSLALAILGIFVGLGIVGAGQPGRTRMLGIALAEVLLTVLVVAPLLYFLLVRWTIAVEPGPLLFAATLGICSSASAAARTAGGDALARIARIVDLDDVPLVVLGSVTVGLAGSAAFGAATLVALAASVCIGLAGWLLFERASGEAERGVFVAGAVALLGGAAAYAGTSPLLTGVVAALIWAWSPGRADRLIAENLRKLQHPLVGLLLIFAGAAVEWTFVLLWVAAPLVLLRLVGKLLASLLVARVAAAPPSLAAMVLLPPGVLGIAVALNVHQVLRGDDPLLLSAVVVATGVSELLSALVLPGDVEGDS